MRGNQQVCARMYMVSRNERAAVARCFSFAWRRRAKTASATVRLIVTDLAHALPLTCRRQILTARQRVQVLMFDHD